MTLPCLLLGLVVAAIGVWLIWFSIPCDSKPKPGDEDYDKGDR
jgi:hypothetical protein